MPMEHFSVLRPQHFPGFPGLLIRQDWLDDLNMKAPKNFDELTDVLRAFKNEKNASMALLVNFECDSGLAPFFNTAFTGFRGVGYQRTEPGSDELVCSYASEGFIDYLLYLNSLMEEGIINDDFMNTGKEYGNWESSYYSGKCGVWQDDCKYVDPAFRENGSDPNWTAAPFALSDIDVHVTMPMTVAMNGKLFLTAACAEPEIAMQYVNYAYTPGWHESWLPLARRALAGSAMTAAKSSLPTLSPTTPMG